MRVKVRLRREGGAYRPPYGQGHSATGELSLIHREGAHDRKVRVLRLIGHHREWPDLFEPTLVGWMGNEFKFVGWERCERAWVLQEWDCELF